jgi:hypothetical protein
MAIEIVLRGSFELTSALEDLLRSEIPGAEDADPVPTAVEFDLGNELISVAGFYASAADTVDGVPGHSIEHRSTLFFHVNDKSRVMEALLGVVRCVGAVVSGTSEDMALLHSGDTPLLARANGKLTLFRTFEESDFWDTPGYLDLLPAPHTIVELPRGR